MEMPMTVSKKIKQAISEFPDDFVFAVSDFDCDVSQREAAARALQRMAENGEISKLSNGKYYKPRVTVFGNLKPSPAQVAKEFLVKDGQVIGYLTGTTAFSQYSLTTQISSGIQIGTNYYRRPLKRGSYNISFVLQPNDIKEDAIDLFSKGAPGAESRAYSITAKALASCTSRLVPMDALKERYVLSSTESLLEMEYFLRISFGSSKAACSPISESISMASNLLRYSRSSHSSLG